MSTAIPGASQEQSKKFEQYLSLLLKWNSTHNLTAIRDPESMVKRHFVESAALTTLLDHAKSLLDLGTGAGFPGLPIAIMRPNLRVTLLESQSKKAAFCQEVIRVCGLANASIVCGRAEDAKMGKLGIFDVIISRAVWSLKDYLPIACRFLDRANGHIIALKGPKYEEEMGEVVLENLNLDPPVLQELSTGGENESERIVLIFKHH